MTERLTYWETLHNVISTGNYPAKNKDKLYEAVQKYCKDNPKIAAQFDFRKRSGVLTSPDVDIALRNLIDSEQVVVEEDSGLIKLVKR